FILIHPPAILQHMAAALEWHSPNNPFFPKKIVTFPVSISAKETKPPFRAWKRVRNRTRLAATARVKSMDYISNEPENDEENQMAATACAQNVPNKRLYTIKELVAEIGATKWFWRSQIWDGQLPYVQVGRKMFIDRLDLEAFIQKNKISN
ncbi:MAG: helix-turn-helix domain-containing protein, partial [Desulfobacterales bacterium]